MNKLEGYKKLFEISKIHGINVDEEVKRVVSYENNDIPNDVLKFIHKYEPQDFLSTYDHIYENRRNNKLYKSLVNENSSISDKAIALSLLLNNCIIKMKSLSESKRQIEYANEMKISDISDALRDYAYGSNEKLEETFNNIRLKLKILYSKEGDE